MPLTAKNIQIGYHVSGNFVALHKDISLQINQGEVILLAGSNGIGKSLLLKTIMGMESSPEGEICLNDQSIDPFIKEIHSRIGYLSATPPPVELMSALEVVQSAQKTTKWFETYKPEDKKKAISELVYCGIEHLANNSFSSLSDGEKQKTMLARALYKSCDYLLLDEPTAFLDHPSKTAFWDIIKKRATEKSQGFLVCSHDLHIARTRADRMYFLGAEGITSYSNPMDFELDSWTQI